MGNKYKRQPSGPPPVKTVGPSILRGGAYEGRGLARKAVPEPEYARLVESDESRYPGHAHCIEQDVWEEVKVQRADAEGELHEVTEQRKRTTLMLWRGRLPGWLRRLVAGRPESLLQVQKTDEALRILGVGRARAVEHESHKQRRKRLQRENAEAMRKNPVEKGE